MNANVEHLELNQWQNETKASSYRKQKGPVEIEFDDGTHAVLKNPSQADPDKLWGPVSRWRHADPILLGD